MGEATRAGVTVTGNPARVLRAGCRFGWPVALLPLAWLDPDHRQVGLLLSWLAAQALYLLQWPRPRGLIRWRAPLALRLALVAYAAALLVIFCLVYDNWRWAATADSLNFYEIGAEMVRGNPDINPLGARGIFEQCTVVQATLQNAFMYLSPSLFAHRLGNLLTSALLVLAASAFAGQTSGATAGLLMALFLPLNSVFAVFTLISYPNLSGVLPYYAAYALFVAAWSVWESDFLWAALGLACGLAAYFLPLWLAAVAAVSAGVVLSALYWRRPRILLIWAGGALVALTPALLQFETFIRVLFVFRPMSGLTLDYVARMTWQALLLPFWSEMKSYGAGGGWLAPPFNYLWLAGVVLALTSAGLTVLRRPRARVLRYAWVWLPLFCADALGLAMANSGYSTVSLKRAIVMLPNMTFLMVLPLAWLAERIQRTGATAVLILCALAGYAYVNTATLAAAQFGYTVADGVIRMQQTVPGRVLLISPHEDIRRKFAANGDEDDLVQRIFQVRERAVVSAAVPQQRADFDRAACFSRHLDGQEWGDRVQAALAGLCPNAPVEPITAELECVRCDPR
ncbi:MAG: hypothetical protein HY699_19865 [Deltaproteobacteria bacterium]|nr:hypothetical protein [Deltaproteobacteria bacterium]